MIAQKEVDDLKKIPRGLSDKDMVKNYVEQESVEEKMLKAAQQAERQRQIEEAEAPPEPLAKSGFTKELTERLGLELVAMKIELAAAGVKKYSYKIKRDGEKIILTVTDKKF